ncbi:unnamed protein product [Effrenium voratum]|nr:unnamed protein product [Effrenium voratum]
MKRIVNSSVIQGTARVWATRNDADADVAICDADATLEHPEEVTSAKYAPKAQAAMIITSCTDHKVRLWDASGKLLRVLGGFSVAATCAVFSPSGRLCCASGANGEARLWDVEGSELLTLHAHRDVATSLAFSSDGQCVVTTSSDGTARVWDIESCRSEALLAGHRDAVMAACFLSRSDLELRPTKVALGHTSPQRVREPGPFPELMGQASYVPIGNVCWHENNDNRIFNSIFHGFVVELRRLAMALCDFAGQAIPGGKSTLLNALLGHRLLPTSYKSCTSAVTSVRLVADGEPTLSFRWKGKGEHVRGRKEVLSRIKALNEEIRESADAKAVVDLCVSCQPSSALRDLKICDGSLRLVDMPGQDETDNVVVKECFNQLLSMCHGLIVLVKHSAVRSDSLAVLLDGIAVQAPHLFSTPGAVTFVISQVDALRQDESDDEGTAATAHAINDLKKELLQYLANRDCLMLFPGFLSDVKVLCVSVDPKLTGGHEFGQLLEAVEELHGIIQDLKAARQVKLCKEIYETMVDRLDVIGRVYPVRAEEVLDNDKQEKNMRQATMAVAAASFLVTIPLGAWGVAMACAVRCAAAGTALGVGVVASAVNAQTKSDQEESQDTLGGVRCLGASLFGAMGAELANQRVTFQRTAASILEGKVYEDTLLDADGCPVYIGEFVGDVPHGQGRLFWKSTNFEAFIGTFKNGQPREGLFINEKGFCVAKCQVSAGGEVKVDGAQLDEENSLLVEDQPLESLDDFLGSKEVSNEVVDISNESRAGYKAMQSFGACESRESRPA